MSTFVAARSRKLLPWLNAVFDSLFRVAHQHFFVFTVVNFLIMLALSAILTPFDDVLREDAYIYLQKAVEITNGDWTPIHTHFIGWPIFLALILTILDIDSIFAGMTIARWASIVLLALSIFPFASLAARLLGVRAAVIAVIAFTLSPPLLNFAGIAGADSLFVFLVMLVGHTLLGPGAGLARTLIPTTFASLAYYVRPNGIFLLLVILLYRLFSEEPWGRRMTYSIAAVLAFFLISSPHLYARYAAYGSPVDYGENSKYFVDSSDDVWDPSVPIPTLGQYLATHTIGNYVNKFVIHGVIRVCLDLFRVMGPLWLWLLLAGILHCVLSDRPNDFGVPLLFVVVMIVSLFPVYHIFSAFRYFLPIVPFALIIGTHMLDDLTQRTKVAGVLSAVFVAVLVGQAAVVTAENLVSKPRQFTGLRAPQVRDQWAVWAAEHLEGKIAIVEGGDLIEMAQLPIGHDTATAASIPNKITTFRPRKYPDLRTALQDFASEGVGYVFVDHKNSGRRPFLREIYDPAWSEDFRHIRSFRSLPEQDWSIEDMDIFAVVYR